jgi:hypothetical protein
LGVPYPRVMIVGDANEGGELEKNQVGVGYFTDPSEACYFGDATTCPTEDEAADFDYDHLSEMQIARLPLTHRWKVARTVENFLNKVIWSIPKDRALLTVGDYEWQGSTPEGLPELMDDLISEFRANGYETRYMRETDYGRYDYLPKQLDTADSLNEGVDIMVNIGTVSNRSRIAGDFIQKAEEPKWNMDWLDDSGMRPFVLFGPTCDVADFDRNAFIYDPILAEMFLCNDPQKPAAVAWISHGRGNWGSWYRIFAQEFVDRLFSGEALDVLDCYWKTKQSCWVRYPEMHNFLRSLFYLGWPVGIRGTCATGVGDILVPDGGESWTRGTTKTIEWQVCFQGGAYKRLRKHSIYLTRDDGGTWNSIEDSVEASAGTYDWYVDAFASQQCRIKVVSHVETYDPDSEAWGPAYTFEGISDGVFKIRNPSGPPCPHLYAWKDGGFSLVNSVLRRQDLTRRPTDDCILMDGCEVDESDLIRFMIDQTEPDTTYFHGARLVLLPIGKDIVVTVDGSLFERGGVMQPAGATDGTGSVLWAVAASDDQMLWGDVSTIVDVVFPNVGCTHALFTIGALMKKPPVDPIGDEGERPGGVELSLEGRGMFVSGVDTLLSIRLSPRQFLSQMAVEAVNIKASDEPLTLRMIWHSEHPVDFVYISPDPVAYVPDSEPLEPVGTGFVPGSSPGEPPGNGALYRLVPGDELYLDFKADDLPEAKEFPCLVTLNGYYVGPSAPAAITHTHELSMWLSTALPCTEPRLAGKFSVPREMTLKLDVYDVRGRLVRQILKDRVDPGVHEFEWNLRNTSGTRIAPGLYFLRFHTPDRTITKKVVIKR